VDSRHLNPERLPSYREIFQQARQAERTLEHRAEIDARTWEADRHSAPRATALVMAAFARYVSRPQFEAPLQEQLKPVLATWGEPYQQQPATPRWTVSKPVSPHAVKEGLYVAKKITYSLY
jgi:hypothetical protein